MDPKGGQGPGGAGDAPAAPSVGRGRAELLRNLAARTPGERGSSVTSQSLSTASAGRGALLRGMSADSTVAGESSISSRGPPLATGGRGALLRALSGAGGLSQSSASSTATSAARQELMAKIHQNRAESVVPQPIGRAGLVSTFYF